LRQGPQYLQLLVVEYGAPLLCLVIVGVIALWRGGYLQARRGELSGEESTDKPPVEPFPGGSRAARSLCALLIAIWLCSVGYAINYEIFDIYVYYIPS